jgi:hypothetical protein
MAANRARNSADPVIILIAINRTCNSAECSGESLLEAQKKSHKLLIGRILF